MSWEVIASLAEVVSAIAVVISLLYLARQIRQASVVEKTSTHHQFLSTQTSANRIFSDNADVCELVDRANKDFEALTSAELIRLSAVYYDHFNQWEFAFDSNSNAMLPPAVWEKINRGYIYWATFNPSFGNVWTAVSSTYGHEFKQYVDETLAKIERENKHS